METQPEVVAAAEVLRAWVHGQRAAWTSDSTTFEAPRKAVPVPVPAPAAAPTPAPAPPVAFEPPVARPVVAPAPPPVRPVVASAPPPVPVTPPALVAKAPAAPAKTPATDQRAAVAEVPVRQPVDPPPTVVAIDEPRSSLLQRWGARAAAVLAVAGALAGGTWYWQRPGTGPSVGTAVFDSAPAGSDVFVDGKPVGTTPVRVELNPGPHGVEFKLKDATRTQTIDIAKGRETAVTVDWNPRRVGSLQVNSTPPGARVLVDGRERGKTPLTLGDLPVGAHTVQIESAEGAVRRRVDVASGRTETVTESIYPGWLQVSSPIDVSVVDGAAALTLDDSHRVLLKAGVHTLRIENRGLEFSQTKQIEIEPGGTAKLAVEVPLSTLTVTGSTGAEVFLDGAKIGQTPLVDFQTRIGSRDVMVVDPSGATRHASVMVTTKPTQLEISFSRP